MKAVLSVSNLAMSALRLFVSLFLCLSFTSVLASEVTSWSLETIEADNSGSYTLIWVGCAGRDAKINLRKYRQKSQWCAQELPEMCADSKRHAAEMVCADDFFEQVSAYNTEKELVSTEPRRIEGMSASELRDELQTVENERERLLKYQRELNQHRQELLSQLGSL